MQDVSQSVYSLELNLGRKWVYGQACNTPNRKLLELVGWCPFSPPNNLKISSSQRLWLPKKTNWIFGIIYDPYVDFSYLKFPDTGWCKLLFNSTILKSHSHIPLSTSYDLLSEGLPLCQRWESQEKSLNTILMMRVKPLTMSKWLLNSTCCHYSRGTCKNMSKWPRCWDLIVFQSLWFLNKNIT